MLWISSMYFPIIVIFGLLILSPPSHKFLCSTTTRNPNRRNRNRNDAGNQFYLCGSSVIIIINTSLLSMYLWGHVLDSTPILCRHHSLPQFLLLPASRLRFRSDTTPNFYVREGYRHTRHSVLPQPDSLNHYGKAFSELICQSCTMSSKPKFEVSYDEISGLPSELALCEPKMDLNNKNSINSASDVPSHDEKSDLTSKHSTNSNIKSQFEPLYLDTNSHINSNSTQNLENFDPINASHANSSNFICSPHSSMLCSNSEPMIFKTSTTSSSTRRNDATSCQVVINHGRGSGNSVRSDSLESSTAPLKPHTGGDVRWDAINSVCLKDSPIGLSNFRLLKRLGYGDIGSVYLVELRATDTYFAMKVMDKRSLASRNKLLRAQTEREILSLLDHPFLPTLYSYFETEKFYCLVMEFCSGGNLHTLRQKQPNKHFSEDAARFYASEVLLALEYLHMLGIVYRDLKPENVLVRDEGHIMLSDFDLSLRCSVSPTLVKSSSVHAGNASSNAGSILDEENVVHGCIQPSAFFPRILPGKKNRKSKSDFGLFVGGALPELMAEPTNVRSMSFVGTHEYLAPEIIRGEGHGSAVDWWTFGIFLYELLHGTTPFKGSGNKATLFNVVGQPLRFPETPQVSATARDLIRGLLIKEPHKRIAYKRGATEIKQHPFFEGVNWALIRSAQPPHVPEPVDFGQFASKEAAHSDKKMAEIATDKNKNSSSDPSYVDFEYF